MNNLTEELLNEIRRRGGLRLPEHTDPWTRHLISQAKKLIEFQRVRFAAMYFEGRGLNLHAAIYNSPSPAAFSSLPKKDRSSRDVLIGISYGYVYNAACLASFMLSRRDMFVEVGACQNEMARLPLNWIPSKMVDSDIHPMKPNCPVREAFSFFLLSRFIENVFMHEVSHLVRGHNGLIREAAGGGSGEGGSSEQSPTPPVLTALSMQALEFDADLGSIEESLDFSRAIEKAFLNGKMSGSKPSVRQAYKCLNLDLKHAAKYIFIAMYLPLRMLGHSTWCREFQESLGHPTALIRMIFLVFIFGNYILAEEIYGMTPDEAKELAFEWAGECEHMYMTIQNQDPDPEGFVCAWKSPDALQYMNDIEAEYGRLEPLLSPHVIEFSFKNVVGGCG